MVAYAGIQPLIPIIVINTVFYSVERTGNIISIGAHGRANEQSNPDANQHISLNSDTNLTTSLDLDTSQPVSVVLPSSDKDLASVSSSTSNHGEERNINLDCVCTGESVSESCECIYYLYGTSYGWGM